MFVLVEAPLPRAGEVELRSNRVRGSAAPRPNPLPQAGEGISLDGLRIDRRAGAASDNQRRAAEEKLVDLVLVTILGEFLQVEDFAHAQPHSRDDDPVPRLVGLGGLVWPHLDTPGVGADRGDFLLVAPVAVLEFHTRRIPASIAAPFTLLMAALHLPGADYDEIAFLD